MGEKGERGRGVRRGSEEKTDGQRFGKAKREFNRKRQRKGRNGRKRSKLSLGCDKTFDGQGFAEPHKEISPRKAEKQPVRAADERADPGMRHDLRR